MSDLQHPSTPPLVKLFTAKWATHLIGTAAELGVADLLGDGSQSVGELAARSNSDPAMLYRLLRALSSLGVVEESEGQRFSLTAVGQPLRKNAEGSLRSLAVMLARPWHDQAWEHLTESVRTGRPAAELAFGKDLWRYLDNQPSELENFNEAMASASSGIHAAAADAYDFSGIEILVDVGGGFGRLLGTILQRYPQMRGMVFDRPHLQDGARAELNRMGVGERCSFYGGDFLTSVVPGGDAYMMSHITHDWPDEAALRILSNCRQVMNPGQKLLVLDAVIKSANEPDWGKLMDVEIGVLFGGKDRTSDEFAELFRSAGFRLERVIPTKSTTSIVEGVAV